MRQLFLGMALCLATLPVDLGCSSDDDDSDGDGPPLQGDGDGDDIIPIGDGDGDGDAPTCPSFTNIPNCEEQGKTAKKREVNLLLVIDKSGSMDDKGGFADTKWETMKAALEEALKEAQLEINVGLSLYPFPNNPAIGINKELCSKDGNCCETPTSSEPQVLIGPGIDTVPLILEQFTTWRPAGGTPTSAALEAAHDYFANGSGKDLTGDNYVVLATDGGPNCNDDISCEADGCTLNIESREDCTPDGDNCCVGSALSLACLDDGASEQAISRLKDAGIDTFVIGIPGSEQYAGVLDSFAEEGGRAIEDGARKYFQVEGQGGAGALAAVFKRITQQLVTGCDIQLSENPPSITKINVAVDCELIPATSTSGGGGAGGAGEEEVAWFLDTGVSPPTVRLRGSLCERVEQGVDRVDVILGCPPVL